MRCGLITAGVIWDPKAQAFCVEDVPPEPHTAIDRLGANAKQARLEADLSQQALADRASMSRGDLLASGLRAGEPELQDLHRGAPGKRPRNQLRADVRRSRQLAFRPWRHRNSCPVSDRPGRSATSCLCDFGERGHRLIDEETANLRRALERATRRDPATALGIAASLMRHWVLGEHFREGRSACERLRRCWAATRPRRAGAGSSTVSPHHSRRAYGGSKAEDHSWRKLRSRSSTRSCASSTIQWPTPGMCSKAMSLACSS